MSHRGHFAVIDRFEVFIVRVLGLRQTSDHDRRLMVDYSGLQMAVFEISTVDLLQHVLDLAPISVLFDYKLTLLNRQPPLLLFLTHKY